ncbi:hypothetical protein HET69_12995 [Streptomyces sp. CJ_13]|uniref:hypothetical protein n=1 Tax=Streptomyces sp. CJ_13 TaxID=2724943 RepID=UPI001BDD7880|nr:hypothetical protein [Streptomyces sp. CJ_13]MBT1184917.1 hypothetical protein [Streptomyces sp. CJ_13]
MKTVQGAGPDRACVLPGRPEWIKDVAYLNNKVLTILASAAEANAYRDDNRYLLPADTYRTAGMTIAALAESVPTDGRAGQVVLYTLPAWKLEALWNVLLVLRRTLADGPDTDVVRELLENLGFDLFTPPRTVERFASDLEKVVSVLTLDLPAVKVVATAVALDEERDEAVVDAYRQITAAWTAAGIQH